MNESLSQVAKQGRNNVAEQNSWGKISQEVGEFGKARKPKAETITVRERSMSEIYHEMESPLTDELIQDAITARIKSAEDRTMCPGGAGDKIYSMLTKGETSDTDINTASKAQFHEKLFNTWRKNLENITEDEYREMLSTGAVKQDFWTMRNYILSYPQEKYVGHLKTFAEKNGRNDLSDSINKYCYDYIPNTGGGGWEYITSYGLNGCKKRDVDGKHIGHRFYLNVPKSDLYDVAMSLVDEYQDQDVPFEFKFDDSNVGRSDSITIYCETDKLKDNLRVLESARDKKPDLFGKVGKPPKATGKIDGWIGYGSEPQETGKESYNTLRSKALWKGVTDSAIDWVKSHKDDQVELNGRKRSLREFICQKVVYDRQQNIHGDRKIEDPNKLWQDMLSNFNQALVDIRKNSIDEKTLQKTLSDTKIGLIWKVHNSDLANSITRLIPYMMNSDRDFAKKVKANVVVSCKELGIDANKFCFDNWTVQEMAQFAKTKERNNEQ